MCSHCWLPCALSSIFQKSKQKLESPLCWLGNSFCKHPYSKRKPRNEARSHEGSSEQERKTRFYNNPRCLLSEGDDLGLAWLIHFLLEAAVLTSDHPLRPVPPTGCIYSLTVLSTFQHPLYFTENQSVIKVKVYREGELVCLFINSAWHKDTSSIYWTFEGR